MIKGLLTLLVLLTLSAAIWFFGRPIGFSTVMARVLLIALLWLPVVLRSVWERVQAMRSARAIERALADQAADHARKVAPDRQGEIEALGKEVLGAIAALKRSRLGRSKGGQAALYALPWYMIVGPPGAGKSTALSASGLSFPYTPGAGRGLRGVGGTRNCDWWFAEEAILIDTAGRYMTCEDDREEWLGFLGFLRKHRPQKPLNGVLVAVSLPELLDAEAHIEDVAARLRARIDEIMVELGIVVPAYVLLTKCDLLAGFVQFFGDLRKREVGQIWGATLPLDEPRSPSEAFAEEFAELAGALDRRVMQRLADEPALAERDLIYQFPLQVRAARQRVGQFIGELFARNPFQDSPIFRGFYFTSGTQEGRPMDRVMSEMARAFGFRARVADAISEPRLEKKSYFLRELLSKVVFADQAIAGRGPTLLDRRRRVERAAMLVAGGLCGAMLLGGVVSSCQNGALVDATAQLAERVAAVPWEEPDRGPEDFERLDKLRARVAELDHWTVEGPPISYGFGIFCGRDLQASVRRLYQAELRKILVTPLLHELSAQLGQMRYLPNQAVSARAEDFDRLKTYLMMADGAHVDRDFLMRRLLPLWKEVLHRRGSAIGDGGMLPHLEAFTRDLASGHFAPPGRDPGLVERARSILRRTPAGDAALASILARAERDLQPVALRDMLGSVSTVIESHDSVAGCYTRLGWEQVVQRELAGVRAELDRDRWVLSDQRANGEAERQALRDRYFQEYSAAWKHFLRGLSVRASADSHQALSDLQALTQDNPPFARILRFAVDQVSLAEPALDHDFAKLREFVGASGAKDSSLGQYLVGLGKLRNALSDFVEDGGDGTKLNDEVRAANELTRKLLLETLDESGRSMVRGLLEGPIGSASASVVKGSAESLSAAWAEEVYAPYKRSLWARYPFGKGADAPMADVVEFLKAGGVLWGFYAAKLGKLLPRQGVKFHPAKSYQRVFGPHFLRCLEAAAEWTDALVPPSAQKLQVDFEVRPQGVAQGVGELELEIDGQRRVYKNGPEEHWTFHWPGDKPGVTLVLRGRTGEVARLSVPGEWALLHFLDAGKLVSSKNGLYTYEWTLAKGAIKVPIVFKPARSVHPLHARPPLVCPSGVH